LSSADALASLLALDCEAVVAQQREQWPRAAGAKGSQIVVFGAGTLGRYVLEGLARAGVRPSAIADNASDRHGTQIDGIDVLSPEQAAARYGDRATFVISTFNTSGPRAQLSALGVTAVPYAWLFAHLPGAMLPYYCLDHPRTVFDETAAIRRAFALMAGEDDRAAFVRQLRSRLFLDFDCPLPQTARMRQTEYFPPDVYRLLPDEVLVDCGAFDGDTVRRFLELRGDAFRRVYACEPDPANRARFEAWTATLPAARREKIRVEAVAVGAARGRARFAATGTVFAGVDAAGGFEVDIVPIDELTAGAPPTLIKMDVEGAELEALDGARRTVAGTPPVLAVCIYHRCDHLWQVPLRIAAMTEGYRFHLRAHAEDCWDACCYAVPQDRDISNP
jgi:FkbM family methyltransferase